MFCKMDAAISFKNRIAAAKGDMDSLARAKAISTKISPAEREAADRTAQAFQPRSASAPANNG